MPQAYCSCCHKTTPHKVIMGRCQSEPCSSWHSVLQVFSLIFHGEHYYKMEKQCYCRICNTQSTVSNVNYSNPRAI